MALCGFVCTSLLYIYVQSPGLDRPVPRLDRSVRMRDRCRPIARGKAQERHIAKAGLDGGLLESSPEIIQVYLFQFDLPSASVFCPLSLGAWIVSSTLRFRMHGQFDRAKNMTYSIC
jgi:hypothetical protein